MSRFLKIFDHSDEQFAALIERHETLRKKKTHKSSPYPPTGSTVAMQREHSSPWIHGTVVDLALRTTTADPTRSR